jgi:hypothetical protein
MYLALSNITQSVLGYGLDDQGLISYRPGTHNIVIVNVTFTRYKRMVVKIMAQTRQDKSIFIINSMNNIILSIWLRAGRPGDRGSIPGRDK